VPLALHRLYRLHRHKIHSFSRHHSATPQSSPWGLYALPALYGDKILPITPAILPEPLGRR